MAAKKQTKKPVAKKQAKAAKPKAGPAHVDAGRSTLPAVCATVIARHGLSVGVTQQMVDSVSMLMGRRNDQSDWFYLKNTWHALVAWEKAKSTATKTK